MRVLHYEDRENKNNSRRCTNVEYFKSYSKYYEKI